MKTKFYMAIIIALLFAVADLNAQTNTFPSTGAAGIGTTSPNTSSLLEIKSTAKGFLMSRMTKNQRDAIAAPATGLLIYQTNSNPGFYYYDGSAWKAVTPKSNGWSITGNAGTNPATNFIGTTDVQPLIFRVGNQRAGFIDTITYNTSFGYKAFISNTTGNFNTANGYKSLLNNTSGITNTAVGYGSLFSNTTGNANTAVGNALGSNSTGIENTAVGAGVLSTNNANDNTSIGAYSLNANTSGAFNMANGAYSLFSNTSGSNNTASGGSSLYSNTTGSLNTAIGLNALYNNETGSYNTGVGIGVNVNGIGFNNSTAIGVYSFITASNQVRIGSIGFGSFDPTSIGGVVSWSTLSDGRVKKNIKQNVPGLAFINKLNPVTYNLDLNAADKILQKPRIKDKDGKLIVTATDPSALKAKEAVIYTGFVAQEVEQAAKSVNYDFSGVDAAKNDKDLYGLRYSDFVVPLVKAVQELSAKNDDLQKQIDYLKAIIVSNQSTVSDQQLTALSSASLQQNIPNPFNNSTTVAYNVPQKFTSAQIVITDKSGNTLKAIKIPANGKGSVTIDASALASGAYQYSLIVDGKLIATKQMVMAK